MVEDGYEKIGIEAAADPTFTADPGEGLRWKDAGAPERVLIAQAWIVAQQRRNAVMGGDLFVSPAWDMLLDLYIALCSARRVAVSDLCVASNVPQATAIRWIGVLQERGLVEKKPDTNDRRRHFVELTAYAIGLLEKALDAVAKDDQKFGVGRLRLIR